LKFEKTQRLHRTFLVFFFIFDSLKRKKQVNIRKGAE
jgi:hypothetical protein